MQKKLLAVAVAGAMFAPLAMAQSSVTISGTIKVGIDNYRIGNPAAARTGLNNSETRITDNSSQIHFNITEDLGGGLAAIAKIDARLAPDDASSGLAESGNTWIGVRSKTLGTLTLGRHDLHYGKQPDNVSAKGALMASSISLMDFAGGGNVAIANATRTPNVIRWDSPNWSGFNLTVAYSTSGTVANEADLTTGIRKGDAWNFNPSYTASNFQVGYSFWKSEADGGGNSAAAGDQRSDSLYGYYRFGAFKVGLGYNRAKIEGATDGVEYSNRKSWAIPVAWYAGPHTVAATYTRAGDDDAIGTNSSAKMVALAYSYDLSKRTAVSLTYARISNDAAATYDFFTNTGGLGSAGSATNAGEDPRLIAATLRHAF